LGKFLLILISSAENESLRKELQGDRILEKSSLRTHEEGVAIQSYMT
jgi:hypothetical protein